MRLMVILAAALLFAPLTGCYPDLDWREVRVEEGAFTVLFPAKPRAEARTLGEPYAGVVMHQWSAKVRDTLFAAGFADFPRLDDAVAADLRNALLRNINGTVTSQRDLEVPGAREITADGLIGGTPARLRLREYRRGTRLYQLIVLGKRDDFSADELDTFFTSFKLLPVSGPAEAKRATRALFLPRRPAAVPIVDGRPVVEADRGHVFLEARALARHGKAA
jgi:hypothetical protein